MNKLNLENEIRGLPQGSSVGIIRSHPIPLGAFTLATGATIPVVGSGIVGHTTVANVFDGISWDDTADENDIISLSWTLPFEFRPSSVVEASGTTLDVNTRQKRCVLRLYLKLRLTDTTGSATANADLKVQVQPIMHVTGGTAPITLASVIEKTVGATDYEDGTEEGFAYYEFDITGNMTEAQRNALTPGATIRINIKPHEAIGTNLRLDLLGAVIVCNEHLTVYDTALRNLY